MLTYLRTDSANKHFMSLVALLDADLRIRDGEEHEFYAQFNKIDMLKHVVLAIEDGQAVGCGAFKEIAPEEVEIKRMFVEPTARRKGIAKGVLTELEHWAAEQGYKACVLETGKKQPEAIALYQHCGYRHIPNYGQYAGVENSVCMRKTI